MFASINNAASRIKQNTPNVINATANATANASYALGTLIFRLSKYSAIFLKDLGLIMGSSDSTPKSQQVAELIGKDLSRRLNAIMVYMNLQTNEKKQIVSRIETILNVYALRPLVTNAQLNEEINKADNSVQPSTIFQGVNPMRKGGRKHKTKKNRRY